MLSGMTTGLEVRGSSAGGSINRRSMALVRTPTLESSRKSPAWVEKQHTIEYNTVNSGYKPFFTIDVLWTILR